MAKKATDKKPKAEQLIVIEPLKQNALEVEIVGMSGSSLVPHAFDEKAKKEMADRQASKEGAVKKDKKKLPPREPVDEFHRSLYWKGGMPKGTEEEVAAALETATFQIPAIAIKAACVQAARMVTGLTMKEARQLLFVMGTDGSEMVDIIADGPPIMRCDTVRIGGINKVTDLRYRGEFKVWRVKLEIQYDAELTSPQTIVNLLNRAGFSVGILEMRPLPSGPGCGGSCGRFKVNSKSITVTDAGEV